MLGILAKDEHSIEFNNVQKGPKQTNNEYTDEKTIFHIFAHKNQI